MTSYIPEHVYGLPWPTHLRPQQPAPLPDIDLAALFGQGKAVAPQIPQLVEAGGVFFLSLAPNDRTGIAYTIERLINMLDQMDGDENLEGTGDDEPSLGWTANGPSALSPDHRIDDDREQEVCDEPHDAADSGDDEFSLGWSEDGSLVGNLSAGAYGIEGDLEPEFGWTEEIDQVRRQEVASGWLVDGGEPTLGFIDHGTGWTGEAVYDDDREDVSEDEGAQDDREDDKADAELFLGWSEDQSLHGCIPTGDEFSRFGNGEAHFDGDGYLAAKDVLRNLRSRRPDIRQEYVPASCSIGNRTLHVEGLSITGKGIRETATRLSDETVMRSFAPEEDRIPEIDLLAHYRAVHGQRPC